MGTQPDSFAHIAHIIFCGFEDPDRLRYDQATACLWHGRPGLRNQLTSEAYNAYLREGGRACNPFVARTLDRKMLDLVNHGSRDRQPASAVIVPLWGLESDCPATTLNELFTGAALSCYHNGATHLTISVASQANRPRATIGIGEILRCNATIDLFESTWLCVPNGIDDLKVGHLTIAKDLKTSFGKELTNFRAETLNRSDFYRSFVRKADQEAARKAQEKENAERNRAEAEAAVAGEAPDSSNRQKVTGRRKGLARKQGVRPP